MFKSSGKRLGMVPDGHYKYHCIAGMWVFCQLQREISDMAMLLSGISPRMSTWGSRCAQDRWQIKAEHLAKCAYGVTNIMRIRGVGTDAKDLAVFGIVVAWRLEVLGARRLIIDIQDWSVFLSFGFWAGVFELWSLRFCTGVHFCIQHSVAILSSAHLALPLDELPQEVVRKACLRLLCMCFAPARISPNYGIRNQTTKTNKQK